MYQQILQDVGCLNTRLIVQLSKNSKPLYDKSKFSQSCSKKEITFWSQMLLCDENRISHEDPNGFAVYSYQLQKNKRTFFSQPLQGSYHILI